MLRAFCLAFLFVLSFALLVQAGPFTPGNLVVLTVGDSTLNVGSNKATAVSLREYTTSGSFVSDSMITFNSGSSGTRLTQSGSQSLEGSLSRSADGQYLTLVGYNAERGRSDVIQTSTSGNPNPANNIVRVVARVDYSGAVNLSTTTTNYSGMSIRSATTLDGERFYTGGAEDGAAGSLRTMLVGATGVSTIVNAADTRVVHVFNGQLYGSTNATIFRTNTALPTSSSDITVLVTVPEIQDAVGFVILDQDNNGVPDTLYVANQRETLSLQKYYTEDGINWNSAGTIDFSGRLNGITGIRKGSFVDLYVTTGTGTVSENTLQHFRDTSAFNQTISGTFTLLATAPVGTAFRGVSFAPTAIPEPHSLLLSGLTCLYLFGRFFRRSTHEHPKKRCP